MESELEKEIEQKDKKLKEITSQYHKLKQEHEEAMVLYIIIILLLYYILGKIKKIRRRFFKYD